MRTGFQRYVQRRAARTFAGLEQRMNFGVRLAGTMMISLADDDAVADDDGADGRIGSGIADRRARQVRTRASKRVRRARLARNGCAPRLWTVRHGQHYRIVHDAAGFPDGVGTIAQRRAGRAHVVEERYLPSGDCRCVANETSV